MLIYDHALDPYHCAIRILTLCIFGKNGDNNFQLEGARILDYFLVYPSKLASFRLPAEYKTIRTSAKEIVNPYRHSPSKRVAFERMRPVFYSATSGLAAAGYIEIESLERGLLKCLPQNIPPELDAAIQRFRTRQSTVGNFIISVLSTIPLNGSDGLKHRSGLLEYRYDLV